MPELDIRAETVIRRIQSYFVSPSQAELIVDLRRQIVAEKIKNQNLILAFEQLADSLETKEVVTDQQAANPEEGSEGSE